MTEEAVNLSKTCFGKCETFLHMIPGRGVNENPSKHYLFTRETPLLGNEKINAPALVNVSLTRITHNLHYIGEVPLSPFITLTL